MVYIDSSSFLKAFWKEQESDATLSKVHCRTLDRLHLAVMEGFGARRLMTHDARQTHAAKTLGFEVISPH